MYDVAKDIKESDLCLSGIQLHRHEALTIIEEVHQLALFVQSLLILHVSSPCF